MDTRKRRGKGKGGGQYERDMRGKKLLIPAPVETRPPQPVLPEGQGIETQAESFSRAAKENAAESQVAWDAYMALTAEGDHTGGERYRREAGRLAMMGEYYASKSRDPRYETPARESQDIIKDAPTITTADLAQAISEALPQADHLRRSPWKGNDNPYAGHCYIASEIMYHALGGKEAGFTPQTIQHEGGPHWFLRDKEGNVIDPTAQQFATPVPYEKARGCGFLTKHPSKRAQQLAELARITLPQ